MIELQISFVIVNYNTARLTLNCIQSIVKYCSSLTYEIIVVDNASSDNSKEVLGKLDSIIYIQRSENGGFGRANNRGAARATGKYLFFLNPDTYLLDNAPTFFFDFMEHAENQGVGCCGGDLIDDFGNQQVCYGNFPTIFELFSQFGFWRLYPRYYREKLAISRVNHSDTSVAVDYICGADMFVRKSVFNELGGFDEDFFMYFEETEFAYRMKRSGYSSVLVPSIRIVHLEGASFKKKDDIYRYDKVRLFEKSRQLYFRKTQGRIAACTVKVILSFQTLIRGLFRWDGHYLKVFRIIVRS